MGSRLFITLAVLGVAAWVLWSANQGGRELVLDRDAPPAAETRASSHDGEVLSGIVSHVHDEFDVTEFASCSDLP